MVESSRIAFEEPPKFSGDLRVDGPAIVEYMWALYRSGVLAGGFLQPADLPTTFETAFPILTNLAAVSGAADMVPYLTGADTWALTEFNTYGRSFLAADDAAAARTVLGLGALATLNSVGTGQITDDSVTFAKFQNITDVRLLGRSAGSAGDMQEITVGSGLTLAAGALLSSITQYTNENAQDAVGGILTDTATINLTYDDAGNTITADIIPAAARAAILDTPSFSVNLGGSNQTAIVTATPTKILFNTELFDTRGCFDAATNNRFTPDVAGCYQFNAVAHWTALASSVSISISIYKNGSLYKGIVEYPSSAGAAPGQELSALVPMNGTTDYVEFFVGQTSGGNLDLLGNVNFTWADGHWACN